MAVSDTLSNFETSVVGLEAGIELVRFDVRIESTTRNTFLDQFEKMIRCILCDSARRGPALRQDLE